MPSSRPLWWGALAVGVLLLVVPTATARPAHKQAMIAYFGPFLPPKMHDCKVCHLPEQPGQSADDERPHNAFGKRMAELRRQRRKAHQDPSIAACLAILANEDSDGDGVSNLVELLTGHSPGDPTDKPSAIELEKARTVTLPAFRKFLVGYQWRPFETVHRPTVPKLPAGWGRNPIDAFIAAAHAENGLTPRPEADKAVLLRRVTLDLTGLPPTPTELHAFLADTRPDAYEQVVDRLLASPRYGERWGRHWMDVWRYSDWAGWSDGKQIRDSQPHIWRWRDWIIESLNADRPYDRMVREMLAGDEIAPNDPNTLRATGYLVRNYKLLSREKWLQDTVEHTFLAFQGVTIGCARCHDHMFDPVLQKDYYQVRAIFEPHQVRIDRLPGQPDIMKDGVARAYDGAPPPTYLLIRGDDRHPDKSKALAPGIPKCLGVPFPEVKPISLPRDAAAPDRRAFVVKETIAASAAEIAVTQRQVGEARRAEAAAVAKLVAVGSPPLALIARLWGVHGALRSVALTQLRVEAATAQHLALLAVLQVESLEAQGRKNSAEWKWAATATTLAQRQAAVATARKQLAVEKLILDAHASPNRPKQRAKIRAAEKAVAKAESEAASPVSTRYTPRPIPTYPATSTGRRTAFAQWLTDKRNPLTARVAVNHIWMRHFGQPLVPSVFDFGRNGRPPSLPALEDWLAAEFMDSGWSMKHLHRLIVTSATYRQSSTPNAKDLARDHDNVYYWRFASHRLEAEVVRDEVLFVSGSLDTKMGGPEIDQHLGLMVPRRSLYFRHAAEKEMVFLKLFDAASVTECYRRKASIVPQQALALSNSDLTIHHARLLARALYKQVGTGPRAFVTAAFERVLSRRPTAAEMRECLAFLAQATETVSTAYRGVPADPEGKRPSANSALRAREDLVQVLFNHHEFVTVR